MTTEPLYPLRFEPVLRRYLWGGRRLESKLGKALGPGEDYAESWEIVDRRDDQSVVSAGPLAGTTLGQLVRERGRELLGRHHPQQRFPLLFKFLDAHQQLSLQVHPDDRRAACLSPPDFGKTEAWVVLEAEPGSSIYAGLKPGCKRDELARNLVLGTCEACIHKIEPKVGDCIFLPAGVVHSLGAGLVVAEIQQSSDTTYRLFDWNRLGPDGSPRALHIKAALEVLDFDRGPVEPQRPHPLGPDAERLVACDKFVLDRRTLNAPGRMGEEDRCHIVVVVSGSATLPADPSGHTLARGSVVLLPAACGPVEIHPAGETVVLDAYLP